MRVSVSSVKHGLHSRSWMLPPQIVGLWYMRAGCCQSDARCAPIGQMCLQVIFSQQ